jgi:asparagine synthase (glutamine-hydrolysing)
MCGIAGWYRRGDRPVSHEVVVAQCNRIIHRGPDDAGYFTDGDLGVGMRRLSIIDIAGGHQPMETPDGRNVIVFNGEIYNHLSLRPALETAGYRFHSHSDTETLLAAYAVWGDDAWLRLEGMYGVAIWDRLTRTLTLARDPIGIKPLYITEQHGGLAFASELKALTLLPDHSFDIDPQAVHDYFSFGHIQRPRSIYRQVRQLDPGHVLRIGAEGPAVELQFWKPRVRIDNRLSEAEWIEETRARVMATVDHHMLSDVPVGSFLSGGVDSAAVTAAMAMQSNRPVTAFTIGFPGNPIDETDAARRIADHLGCNHIVRPVDLMKARDVIPLVQRAFDEPSGASAAIPTWYISKLASEHVKVILSGEGGDELFAGYKRHFNVRRADRWGWLWRALGPARHLAELLPTSPAKKRARRRLAHAAQAKSGFQRFIAGTEISTLGQRRRLLTPALSQFERSPDQFEEDYFDPEWAKESMLQQFMLGDLTVHMPSALLNRLDRMSMAHSLEARVPLLSHAFIDWTLTMPMKMKARGVGKYALREACRPWLPQGALDRKKQGFQMPLKDWFRGDFASFAKEAWHDSGAADAGFLDNHAVDTLFEEHLSGGDNRAKLLYAVTMFACWWQDQRDSQSASISLRQPNLQATLAKS